MQLTPAEQYAGEILSYLLPYVLGQEGRLKGREDWQKRALEEELDFNQIAAKMEGSNNGKSDLLVFDSNLLGLSAVLYHYSRNLNLFKGRYIYDSLYPSSELIALRLLLLQKIHRGEKARLDALVERKAFLTAPRMEPTDSDLQATGLNRQEMRLLGDVLQSEPVFGAYLQYPFLVASLYRLGAVTKDAFVDQKIEAANYALYPACSASQISSKGQVVIALLPSLTKEFEYGGAITKASSPFGFVPTPTLRAVTDSLQHQIVEHAIALAGRDFKKKGINKILAGDDQLTPALTKVITERVVFCVQDQRPLVIYPGNASRVLQDVSSLADLNIILLGKDVYLAMEIQTERDVHPHTNRIYLDLMDVKHNQVDEEVDQISTFILSKLKDDLSALEVQLRTLTETQS